MVDLSPPPGAIVALSPPIGAEGSFPWAVSSEGASSSLSSEDAFEEDSGEVHLPALSVINPVRLNILVAVVFVQSV